MAGDLCPTGEGYPGYHPWPHAPSTNLYPAEATPHITMYVVATIFFINFSKIHATIQETCHLNNSWFILTQKTDITITLYNDKVLSYRCK